MKPSRTTRVTGKAGYIRRLLRAWWSILFLCGNGCAIDHAVRMADGQRVGVEQMIAEVRDTPVVLIGEQHDEAAHHELQLAVIRGIHDTGKPLAIALEMFAIDSQPALDAWIAGQISEDRFIGIYQANWRNLSWGLYRDIFLFAREYGIPMVALNAPPAIVEIVAQRGFAGLAPADLRALPAVATSALSAADIRAMTAYYPRHGKTGEGFRRLCEAQALRNRVMATGIVRYRAQHPEARVVVLTGGIHAWRKGGIPVDLGDLAFKVILPPLPGIAIDAGAGAADFLLD